MLIVVHRTQIVAAAAADLVAAGADAFEIDIQLAGRGLVGSHAIPVHRALPAFRHDGPRFSWSREPPGESLADVLAVVPAAARVVLDLKDDRGPAAFALARAVATAGLDPARTLACSKHWPSLDLLADAGFGVWRSVADRAALSGLLAGPAPGRGPAGSGLSVRHTHLTRQLIAELKRFGVVVAWTVNDVGRALRLVEWGVDGVTTDRPDVMRAVRAATTPQPP